MRELRKLREGLVEGLKERPAVRQGRMPASPQTLQHWATIKKKTDERHQNSPTLITSWKVMIKKRKK